MDGFIATAGSVFDGVAEALASALEEGKASSLAMGAAGLLVGLTLFKLATAPTVPTITVPLEPAEASDDGLQGPSCPAMELKDPKRPGFVQCYDPCTMQRLGEVKAMTKQDVEDLVKRAHQAQEEWSRTSFAERRRVLDCLQKYILSHQEDICRVACRDSGKPMVDAVLGEVLVTCEKIRAVNAHGEAWLAPEARPPGPMMFYKKAYVEYRPLGVLGVIAPWNYPFHNVFNHIVSGIFAGNAVLSKVSEYTCWSSRYFSSIMAEVLRACGHNPDLVQTVTGFGEAGAALVAAEGVNKIIFTGSPGVGQRVMEGASKYVKPVVLELGGKDAMVVCDDAMVGEVLPFAMRGVFQNLGQNCIGAERLMVYEKVYEEFLAAALKEVKQLRQGPVLGGAAGQVDLGAMVTPAQMDIIQALVDDAVAKGARLLTGGKRNPAHPGGLFYEPTILADVTADMDIYKEEVFGPVMTVIKVPGNSDDTCLDMINSSRYGLGSSVFSRDQGRATRLGNGIRAGMTVTNDFGVNYLVQSLPFGGVKESGFGRFAGPEGLRACCLQKSVVVDRVPWMMKTTIPPPLQYPIGGPGMSFATSLVSLMYGPGLLERAKAVGGIIRAGLGLN